MTTVEVTDLPRYIAWADGFLPPRERFESILLPEFKDELQKRSSRKDHPYLRTLETTMRTKYHAALGIAPECTGSNIYSDVYIIVPTRSPPFPNQYNPVHEELNTIKNRTDDYRMFCMVLSEQVPNELREAFFDSLEELKFEIKPDNTYKDLPRFKEFLHDLSYTTLVDPYYAPSILVEDDLKRLGFNAECHPVL